MSNATQPPRRMRFSFESRCRLVSLVLAGESPQAAAAEAADKITASAARSRREHRPRESRGGGARRQYEYGGGPYGGRLGPLLVTMRAPLSLRC
jgi:hypothetical protein